MKPVRSFAFGLAILILGIACERDAPTLGRRTEAILSADYDDTTPPYDFPQVVRLGGCTGTLISPVHVLTAAHCVDDIVPSTVSFQVRPGVIDAVAVAGCRMDPGYVRAIDGALYHDGFGRWTSGDHCGVLRSRSLIITREMRHYDRAVLALSRPVPHAIPDLVGTGAGGFTVAPTRVVSADTLPAEGAAIEAIAVGYGSGVRAVRELFVSMRIGTEFAEGALELLERGDSGGPLFARIGADIEVVGVASAAGGGEAGSYWSPLGGAAIREFVRASIDADRTGAPDLLCHGARRNLELDANATNDTDGDWVLDERDTCPGTYNPCQVGTDADADGLDDDCDACPGDPTVAVSIGDPSLGDIDGDSLPDACDCAPKSALGSFEDPDADFIPNGCDNCPGVANTLQEDCDGTGAGDACAPLVQDEDEDGADDACIDNCPGVRNRDQANCNADAEQYADIPPLGDACDPTPCGQTRLAAARYPWLPALGIERLRHDRVEIDARSTVPQEARTGLRFCPCGAAEEGDSVEARLVCAMAEGCSLALRSGGGEDTYSLGEQEEGWRRPTVSWEAGETFGSEVIAAYGPHEDGIFVIDAAGHWKLREGDDPRWSASFFEPTGEDRPGVLWTHTPGPSDGSVFGDGVRELASHYWSGVLGRDQPYFSRPLYLRFLVLPRLPRACWVCQGHFPQPFLGLDDGPGAPMLVTALGALDAVDLAGATISSFDLPEGLAWVSAAESEEQLGQTNMRMVAIDPVKALVGDLLVEQAGRFERRSVPHIEPVEGTSGASTLSDPAAAEPAFSLDADARGFGADGTAAVDETVIIDRLPDPPDDASAPPARARAEASALAVAASPAGAPLAAMSARLERLWIFLDNRDVRIVDLRTGRASWMKYPNPVLAVTYSAADGALYVLDVYNGLARLVRIDTDAVVGEVLGKWKRTGHTTRFALTSSPRGSLWVVASDDVEHTVAWLDVGPLGATTRAVERHPWPILPGVASAGSLGVSFVVEGAGGVEPVGYRGADFVGSGLGVEACF